MLHSIRTSGFGTGTLTGVWIVSGYGETNSYFNPKPTDITPAYEVVGLAGSIMVVDSVRVGLYVNNLFDEDVDPVQPAVAPAVIGPEMLFRSITVMHVISRYVLISISEIITS